MITPHTEEKKNRPTTGFSLREHTISIADHFPEIVIEIYIPPPVVKLGPPSPSNPLFGSSSTKWRAQNLNPHPAKHLLLPRSQQISHCPFVKHLKKDIVKLSNFYIKKGLAVIANSSNSVTTYPQDGPKFMAEDTKLFNYPLLYLYDESQDVARNFGVGYA
ncbi:Thioredoxin superfamily protein [Striga hermonthica]|uniref:Thioredoxin superfamily protein n=1 Tax=Striga hermonthica TaxID=68872 RepID=A0A9N7MP30_STRHE|nr:Thioredoxin superfamily protein [Striga hermonthica]